MTDWDAYLLRESGLPGPRGNLELAQAVAEEGDRSRFERYLEYGPEVAPTNTPQEFLAFCGVVGLGRLLAEGDQTQLAVLRAWANDPRWRLREAVAMALQRYGDRDFDGLLVVMGDWAGGELLERRAVVAALCEPRLLSDARRVELVLDLLDRVTATLEVEQDRRGDGFIALRKALGYGWSVAVAAHPASGKPRLQRWLNSPNPDVRWVLRENLKKNRLLKMDPTWVEQSRSQLN
jgi:hypothetical protein